MKGYKQNTLPTEQLEKADLSAILYVTILLCVYWSCVTCFFPLLSRSHPLSCNSNVHMFPCIACHRQIIYSGMDNVCIRHTKLTMLLFETISLCILLRSQEYRSFPFLLLPSSLAFCVLDPFIKVIAFLLRFCCSVLSDHLVYSFFCCHSKGMLHVSSLNRFSCSSK